MRGSEATTVAAMHSNMTSTKSMEPSLESEAARWRRLANNALMRADVGRKIAPACSEKESRVHKQKPRGEPRGFRRLMLLIEDQ
jgi:hypothetical protein